MAWHARLSLDYGHESSRTVARYAHEGPLRILQSLYPEGDAICHNVLVHPPSGLVAGDRLDIRVSVEEGAHGLITTPGATRFYRSEGEPATQHTRLSLAAGARMEWLPLEAICYSGCLARNEIHLALAPGAELMGWDITALGLPEAGQPFARGSLLQHIELEGAWLERGLVDASDRALMDGPLGLAGMRCMATLFLASGSDLSAARRQQALDSARDLIGAHALAPTSGATACGQRVVVVRVLSPLVESAMQLLKAIRSAWRPALWNLPSTVPRTWAL